MADGTVTGLARFPIGRTVATAPVDEVMRHDLAMAAFVLDAITRHASGDWGDVSPSDAAANERAIGDEARIWSIYDLPDELDAPEARLYVITEADRSATTVLFPSDY